MQRRVTVAGGLMCLVLIIAGNLQAQDWSQWRGANRDAKAAGFEPPARWPAELTQQWKVSVGDGVATPALAGNRLYVFARQEGQEILRCLDAATGKEIWQEKYETDEIRGPAGSFSGPRSSPTVAEGKVVTLGAHGTLSCYEAETGKLLWRDDQYQGSVPRFHTSSSPIVVDGLCIAQLGSDEDGAIIAYDLASGKRQWEWPGSGPAYGSPVLLTLNGLKAVVTPTASSMVAVAAPDGQLLWEIPYQQGRYNAATPIIEGQLLIYAGPTRGMTALKLQKEGDQLTASEAWTNPDNSLQFNTPVLKDGLLFGISNLNSLFCVDAETGETKWSAPLGTDQARAAGGQQGGATRQAPPGERRFGERQPGGPPEGRAEGRRGEGQPGARRTGEGQPGERRFGEGQPGEGRARFGQRGRGGPGGGGYGSVVDAGSVLFALTPAGTLVVVEPDAEQFKQLASYKVAESGTYAYPVVSGKRIYIKDQDAVTLWTVE